MSEQFVVFWFRRDLRLNDNTGLYHALNSGFKVILLYIFDNYFLSKYAKNNQKFEFIKLYLNNINKELRKYNTEILIKEGKPLDIFDFLKEKYRIKSIYANHDYEPYSIKTDNEIKDFLNKSGIDFITFKDQVIFEKNEIIKSDGKPYTIFTPYKNNWIKKLNNDSIMQKQSEKFLHNLYNLKEEKNKFLITEKSNFNFPEKKISIEIVKNYHKTRDCPSLPTSRIGVHLRYGTISIREAIKIALSNNNEWLNELIWREFFMQIIYHFPFTSNISFKKKYDNIEWRNNEIEFEKWCNGETGYSIIDAGIRELNETGFMHNRVRMITASFLCKHLLIDWRWGEAYFSEKLLDYELSANVGNWQWSAGSGCDAAPYFRIFNPFIQISKFDPNYEYIKKWVPDYNSKNYNPIVDHTFARERCLITYKKALSY